jgi:hypothetical protein
MGDLGVRAGRIVVALGIAWALVAGTAAADPGSGKYGTVDQTFTTTTPGSPTGLGFDAVYHAADDPNGDPPFMEKMTFYPPAGMRYDTSIPEACTASDFELSMQGPAACPEGSQIGDGTTKGVFFYPFAHDYELDRYTHNIYVMNNVNEQIILVEAEGYAVVRGRFQPDGSLEFASPTCFPTPPTGCVDDHILQTATTSTLPELTTASGSYATTPPTCPEAGHWSTLVRFWWKTGEVETLETTQPCSAKRKKR